MPLNRAFFSPFPPMSGLKLRSGTTGQSTEETVEKYASLLEVSGGYESRGGARGDLDRRYQKIGISAVAAAVRYQGDARPANNRDSKQATTKSKA
jgi:hypothetical protein